MRKALAINGDLAEAHHGVGLALQALGELEEAVAAFERAIRLAPRRTDFRLALSQYKRFTADDPRLVAIEAPVRGMIALSDDSQIALCFGLARPMPISGTNGLLSASQRAKRSNGVGRSANFEQFDQIRRASCTVHARTD